MRTLRSPLRTLRFKKTSQGSSSLPGRFGTPQWSRKNWDRMFGAARTRPSRGAKVQSAKYEVQSDGLLGILHFVLFTWHLSLTRNPLVRQSFGGDKPTSNTTERHWGHGDIVKAQLVDVATTSVARRSASRLTTRSVVPQCLRLHRAIRSFPRAAAPCDSRRSVRIFRRRRSRRSERRSCPPAIGR